MSKEYLEALDRMSFHRFDEQYEEWDSDYATVENYLESIDNAKPSEALDEIFNIIYNFDCGTTYEQDKKLNEYRETIKQALIKAQEQEKVLEILKEKRVDLSYLRCCIEDNQSVERYNEYIRNKTMEYDHEVELTQEEFDAVKRWLG